MKSSLVLQHVETLDIALRLRYCSSIGSSGTAYSGASCESVTYRVTTNGGTVLKYHKDVEHLYMPLYQFKLVKINFRTGDPSRGKTMKLNDPDLNLLFFFITFLTLFSMQYEYLDSTRFESPYYSFSILLDDILLPVLTFWLQRLIN